VRDAIECPQDADHAAVQMLGGAAALAAMSPRTAPMPMDEPVSGPRRWLRSATSIFSIKDKDTKSVVGSMPTSDARAQSARKFDVPRSRSVFAKRRKSSNHTHTGDGRRDQLTAGERTRILRMLRDEGGRLADEDSQVYIATKQAVGGYDFELDDWPAPAPLPVRPDVLAKPAVVVGLAEANSARRTRRSGNIAASSRSPEPPRSGPQAPLRLDEPLIRRARPGSQVPPFRRSPSGRRPVPALFGDEPTRQVDDELLTQLRAGELSIPQAGLTPPSSPFDEPTRLVSVDPAMFESLEGITTPGDPEDQERTRAVDIRNDKSILDVDWDLD
jgi:hypothetical protein